MEKHVFLEMSNISMTFPGVKALDQVSLNIREGEVHALMGENGAGKSTLIKIISGVQQPDPGAKILLDGKEVEFPSVHASIQSGINAIHQDLSLFPNLTVAENIYLGRSKKGKIDWKECDSIALEALERLSVQMDIHELLGNLRKIHALRPDQFFGGIYLHPGKIFYNTHPASLAEDFLKLGAPD